MKEDVTVEPPVLAPPTGATADGGVEFRFPVEVEVLTTVARVDTDEAVRVALSSLASALRSA
jgi:hypothetical protein